MFACVWTSERGGGGNMSALRLFEVVLHARDVSSGRTECRRNVWGGRTGLRGGTGSTARSALMQSRIIALLHNIFNNYFHFSIFSERSNNKLIDTDNVKKKLIIRSDTEEKEETVGKYWSDKTDGELLQQINIWRVWRRILLKRVRPFPETTRTRISSWRGPQKTCSSLWVHFLVMLLPLAPPTDFTLMMSETFGSLWSFYTRAIFKYNIV